MAPAKIEKSFPNRISVECDHSHVGTAASAVQRAKRAPMHDEPAHTPLDVPASPRPE